MSDLDFSICVLREDESYHVQEVWRKLKKVFWNLGEVEIYTIDEMILMEKYQTPEFANFWRNLILLRKLNWISKSTSHPYHSEKNLRSLNKIIQRLSIHDKLIPGELFNLPKKAGGDPWLEWSSYLNCWIGDHQKIGIDGKELTCVFSSAANAKDFQQILPSEFVDVDSSLVNLKTSTFIFELMLIRASFRLGVSVEKPFHEKVCSILKKNGVDLPVSSL